MLPKKFATALLSVFTLALTAQERQLPILQYVDGHGNSYEFTQEGSGYVLDFAPVKKNMKSRKYDGGEPATRRVNQSNYEKVLARMDKAIKKYGSSRSRDHGTSLIIKLVKGDTKEYVLPKDSKDIKEIEALLYTLF
jgi:hypothetical protein